MKSAVRPCFEVRAEAGIRAGRYRDRRTRIRTGGGNMPPSEPRPHPCPWFNYTPLLYSFVILSEAKNLKMRFLSRTTCAGAYSYDALIIPLSPGGRGCLERDPSRCSGLTGG